MSRGTFLLLPLLLGLASPVDAAEAAAPRPNVLLVTLDTTRADHLGAWGWSHAATPTLDRLSREGIRFAHADTAAPLTLPSHATLMTGSFPPRHGVRDNGIFTLAADRETLAEALGDAGYDTAAVVSSAVLARRYGLDQGFREYDDRMPPGSEAERPADEATDHALEQLAGLRRPFFLWVHYFDPHEAYEPPVPAEGPFPGYDGEIAFVDRELGRLLRAIPEGTLVVVVGDHGEMLGDHGEATHGLLLERGVRRVPLVVWGLGAMPPVRCPVRTADVAPTILALAGVAASPTADGEDLAPLWRQPGAVCDREVYAETFQPYYSFRWSPLRAIGDARWLYVYGPRPRLYNLEADPAETRDVAAEHPEVARRWREELEAKAAAAGESLRRVEGVAEDLDPEQRRRLESLGYLSHGAGPAATSDLPDPRSMLDIARRFREASHLVQEARCDEALPILVEITKKDAANYPALDLAGMCLLEQGRTESALNAFRRAASFHPHAVEPLVNAGWALLRLDRLAEAREVYERAFALDPAAPPVAANLAQLLRRAGEPAEARRVVDTAIAAGSHHPGVFRERAVDRAAHGDRDGALADLLVALQSDPESVDLLQLAARTAFELGRFRQAAALLERVVALEPGRRDVWATLAGLYEQKLGEPEKAAEARTRAGGR